MVMMTAAVHLSPRLSECSQRRFVSVATAVAAAVATAQRPGLVADLVAWWAGLDARAKLRWMLSSKGPRPPALEKFMRGPGCAAWVPAMRRARDHLVVANAPMLAALSTTAAAP